MEKPTMGRTAQFAEVVFNQPQAEGSIVRTQITGWDGTQLKA
jgi:threonylcarbamoyladenosine tRNA methylthiotransferase MtaB